jgi:two-component system, LytTR family, response regulator
MIRVVVIDDEKPSREVICNYLKQYCDEVQVVATASSVKNAYKAIKKNNPDLVFLDIELGDGKGFDLLTMFEKISFKIVFVTAYSEYAIKAFRINAIDYLLKPVKIDELKIVVEKARSVISVNTDSELIIEIIKNFSCNTSLQPTIIIPHTKGFDVLKVNEIIMCKADGYCTNFILTGNRKVMSSKHMKHYETFLSEHNFFRVHHSYIINLNHVCSYARQGEIVLTEGNKAFLSDSNSHSFFNIFINK